MLWMPPKLYDKMLAHFFETSYMSCNVRNLNHAATFALNIYHNQPILWLGVFIYDITAYFKFLTVFTQNFF